ncbi:cytochrome b6f subunit family protein [Prochlorococcus marinus]|uniref:cytochrome b6-f complex subunit PetP n=1 Tax=Prochlorococcus marinus TaxID=1219 RepID=UPI0022B33ED0|nr:cytochrome b6f subunit family protein [Prochlorococcus marinus]
MIKDSSKLKKGQLLKIDIDRIADRFNNKLLEYIKKNPTGKLIGYKMVDGNQFGLVLDLSIGSPQWFFEEELSEITQPNK